jgi:citrate lyase subunit beta/citryl-CoA lyase
MSSIDPLLERVPLRSMLFVPGDSERKLLKGQASAADALILDLEDSVASGRKALARGLILEFLKAHRDRARQRIWVRINPLSEPAALLDLMLVAGAPDGIVLPKAGSASDVVRLAHMLDVLEVREGVPAASVAVIPLATETPAALFTLGSYAKCSARLAGLTWGAEDLAAALGAISNRLPSGDYDAVYQLARSLCLSAAVAAGVQPIDTIWSDYADHAGLKADAEGARRAGFMGKLAIHPDQVAVINGAFTPSEDELAWSRRVVAAFAGNPGLGTVGLEGKMLDLPHFKQAWRMLALAQRLPKREP